ncbi:hypothetical protein OIU74_011819 [Salix koriyanagi]|uniref:Uncharacterized protein n=1 Tax=Salix koriyanagi TaxID=2511006 RepID=A0A9Q0YUZ8_9ROSI|nr:hypothetical protein OIU74_011819 [Salix koriyanagi]
MKLNRSTSALLVVFHTVLLSASTSIKKPLVQYQYPWRKSQLLIRKWWKEGQLKLMKQGEVLLKLQLESIGNMEALEVNSSSDFILMSRSISIKLIKIW